MNNLAKSQEATVLAARLQRAEDKVKILESMIEDTTRDLYLANRDLRSAMNSLRGVHQAMPAALIITDENFRIIDVNDFAAGLVNSDVESLRGQSLNQLWPQGRSLLEDAAPSYSGEQQWAFQGGTPVPVLVTANLINESPGRWICVGVDQRERLQLEAELRQAQKLEAVGQLAAGVAHEINTPLQFIGDNLNFLGTIIDTTLSLLDAHREAIGGSSEALPAAVVTELETLVERADLDYIRRRGPRAVERTSRGVKRVSEIVSALKRFSHPGQEATSSNVNDLVQTALVITKNEYKYVADIDAQLGQVPLVQLWEGEVQQALLNLIVNAAHAITESRKLKGNEAKRGTITVKTELRSDSVILSVADDGIGIPPQLQERVFEPFFTTKEVGAGTGQGLAQVHAMARRHDARVELISTPQKGTRFNVHFPLKSKQGKQNGSEHQERSKVA